MEIIFSEERKPGASIVQKMTDAAMLCLAEENVEHDRVEISVSFVSEEEMRALNKLYRGIDKATDVLSFPQYGEREAFPKTGDICIGDVVICTDQALLQADEFGHSPEREIVYLFVHSLYHLLGYDHETEGEEEAMRLLEEKVMRVVFPYLGT